VAAQKIALSPQKFVGCLLLTAVSLSACSAPSIGTALPRRGEEISVCGQLFHAGTRVVLWNDPHGYDAYRAHCRWAKRDGPESVPDRTNRFGSFRRSLAEDLNQRVHQRGWKLRELQTAVSQVVFHYDACGTSRRCFEVLHDLRGLSTHFMVDLDGTVYQTLDLKERAWHAAFANDRSVGIEIAHIGAYEDMETLNRWCVDQGNSRRIRFPDDFGENGLPPNFTARPARPGVFEGTINGKALKQYDFTEAQYQALEKLTVALCRVFPRIRPTTPLQPDGSRLNVALPGKPELRAFEGLLGHYHITTQKIDPGPAFDWDRIEQALRKAGF
jgi:N-acetylmuramoyl-L-alanine amidase